MPFSPELYRLAVEMSAPNGYGWYNENWHQRVENSSESIISLEEIASKGIMDDIEIHRSLGAKAKNYDIYDPETDDWFQFVEGSYIRNTEAFAGKDTKKSLHEGVAEGLSEQFGGIPENWQHCKGLGMIDYYGEERQAEVHWFQEVSVGKIKFKIKRWFDES